MFCICLCIIFTDRCHMGNITSTVFPVLIHVNHEITVFKFCFYRNHKIPAQIYISAMLIFIRIRKLPVIFKQNIQHLIIFLIHLYISKQINSANYNQHQNHICQHDNRYKFLLHLTNHTISSCFRILYHQCKSFFCISTHS